MGRIVLEPPPAGATPRVSARRALRAAFGLPASGGGTARVVLGILHGSFPSSDIDRSLQGRLVWVFYIHGVAINSAVDLGPGPGVPRAVCGIGDFYAVMDATTGKLLLTGG